VKERIGMASDGGETMSVRLYCSFRNQMSSNMAGRLCPARMNLVHRACSRLQIELAASSAFMTLSPLAGRGCCRSRSFWLHNLIENIFNLDSLLTSQRQRTSCSC